MKNRIYFFDFLPELTSTLTVPPEWHKDWLESQQAKPYFAEYSDGGRFQQHPLVKDSIRNVLVHISVDWLPIFENGRYSLGLLSLSPASFSTTRRARQGVYPLVIIDRPHEPKHLSSVLGPILEEFAELSVTGIQVFDCLTQSHITVKVSPICAPCDIPAASKLSEFKSSDYDINL